MKPGINMIASLTSFNSTCEFTYTFIIVKLHLMISFCADISLKMGDC